MKIMRYLLSISLVILTALNLITAPAYAISNPEGELTAFLDRIINTKLENYHIPNAAVSIVKDGKVIYSKGFGIADTGTNAPVDADTTLFRIGSTSKLVTWTAVMQLVESGKLDLNEDVNKYLDFNIPDRVITSPNRDTAAPITLTHLLTHTPGFEDYPNMLFRLKADELLPLDEYIKKYMPLRIFPAGEVAAYSNYGTALAGYIVERVSGIPFMEYVDKNIFRPLEMGKSTFQQPLTSELSSDIAKPYRFIDGTYVEGEFEYILPTPAGSMSSTGSDMAKFMLANLNGGMYNGKRILKEETLAKMHTQHFTHHPSLGGMTLGFMEGSFNGKRTVFHGGGTMLYSTGLYLIPEENIGIFMTYSGESHLIHSEVFQEFMDYYYPASKLSEVISGVGSKKNAIKYKGEYQMNRKSLTTAEKSNSLFIGIITVDVDKDGYLLVTNLGEANKFVEIEQGVYQNLREGRTQDYFGPFHRIVFTEDSGGRIMLTTDGPMTYSKAPFYATMGFAVPALFVTLLTIVGSLIYWLLKNLINLIKRRNIQGASLASAAQWVSICTGIAILVLSVSVLLSGDNDPVYQLPKDAYIPEQVLPLLSYAPSFIWAFSSLLLLFTVLAWWKNFWKSSGKIHYTTFTLAVFGLLGILSYWNLF